ncbi:MAG: hypothetical protein LBJ10_10445 [Clostridiales bacterium]|jgi:hypothetical protein|nr:hypothetical protein [Clostridiales bacterium]
MANSSFLCSNILVTNTGKPSAVSPEQLSWRPALLGGPPSAPAALAALRWVIARFAGGCILFGRLFSFQRTKKAIIFAKKGKAPPF